MLSGKELHQLQEQQDKHLMYHKYREELMYWDFHDANAQASRKLRPKLTSSPGLGTEPSKPAALARLFTGGSTGECTGGWSVKVSPRQKSIT
jgi:hypothetical protein